MNAWRSSVISSSPAQHPGESAPPGGWLLAAAVVALVSMAARFHNAFAYPPLRDFDGAGHALNAFALHGGELPDPLSWSGFHPPLAYAVGAGLWRLLPESVPVHASLRLASAAAGIGALFLIWRELSRRFPAQDAAAVSALALSAPVVVIATSMIGNEALCTFWVTACLVWLMRPFEGSRAVRHAAVTGLMAGAATLSKSTGLVVVAAAALFYALRLRRDPRRLAATVATLLATSALLTAPHTLRLMRATGSGPLAVMSGGVGSPDARGAMQVQPPGERHLSDYLRVPPATFLAPFYLEPGMLESVPGLLYASTWADAHAQFLPPGVDPAILRAEVATSLGGLLPTALAAWGLVTILRRRRELDVFLGPFLFGALLAGAFAVQAWTVPHYSAIKASYLLPAALPASVLLAAGLGELRRARGVARAGLLALAAACTALTWYGWWS